MSWGVLSSEGLESQSHQSRPIVFKRFNNSGYVIYFSVTPQLFMEV